MNSLNISYIESETNTSELTSTFSSMLIIFMIGILLNTTSIILLLVKTKKLKPIIVFLLNLAVANLVYQLGMPFYLINMLEKKWLLNGLGCRLFFLLDYIGMSISMFTVTGLSLELYIETLNLFNSNIISNKFKLFIVYIYLIIVWLISFFFYLPYILSLELYQIFDEKIYICESNWSMFKLNIFFLIKLIFGFIIPFVFVVICIIRLILFIKRKNVSSQFNQTEETALNNENVNKIAYKEYIKIKISLVIIVLFFSKFILIWIFELYQAVSDSVINVQSVNIIVSFLQYINTVIDPILYFYIINYL
jgi:uncharacterized membrane protein